MIDALNMEGLAAVNADQMREEFPLSVDSTAHRLRAADHRATIDRMVRLAKAAVKPRETGIPDYEPPTEPHLIAPARLPGTL